MNKLSKDINAMHHKFGVHEWVNDRLMRCKTDELNAFLQFRLTFLQEELNETQDAFMNEDAEGVVDGLIDLMVIAIGTLDILDVNTDEAWDRVHEANMAKEKGVKESRPNPLGLPDMIKPHDWIEPDHSDNTGDLEAFL